MVNIEKAPVTVALNWALSAGLRTGPILTGGLLLGGISLFVTKKENLGQNLFVGAQRPSGAQAPQWGRATPHNGQVVPDETLFSKSLALSTTILHYYSGN